MALVKSPASRAKCYYRRKLGLFNQAYKLETMTGANVLVIVEKDSRRRFYGSGKLQEEFIAGTLKGRVDEREHVENNSTRRSIYKVKPLDSTPSPSSCDTSALSRVIGAPTSRRTLQLNSVPKIVSDVLNNRPRPVLLNGET